MVSSKFGSNMSKMLILTNFKEKHKLNALGQLSTKHSTTSSIGKILVSSRIRSYLSKMLILKKNTNDVLLVLSLIHI